MPTTQELNPLVDLRVTPETTSRWKRAALVCGKSPQRLARSAIDAFLGSSRDPGHIEKQSVRFAMRIPRLQYERLTRVAIASGESLSRLIQGIMDAAVAEILTEVEGHHADKTEERQ